jgi:hypothetical protein
VNIAGSDVALAEAILKRCVCHSLSTLSPWD